MWTRVNQTILFFNSSFSFLKIQRVSYQSVIRTLSASFYSTGFAGIDHLRSVCVALDELALDYFHFHLSANVAHIYIILIQFQLI